jgi:hypothetical protein
LVADGVAVNALDLRLPDTGHWIMEESPQATTDALMSFLGAAPASASSSSSLPEMRLTPAEVRASQTGSNQIGSSGLAGVSTGGVNHFARTGTEPVLVEISGFGPTDTRYVDPANASKTPALQ